MLTAAALVGARLYPLLFRSNDIELGFSPNELSQSELPLILAILAANKSIGKLIGKLPGLWPWPGQNDRPLVLSAPIRVTNVDFAHYQAAVDTEGNGNTPALEFLHLVLFLAAVSEPAMLLLLVAPACPIDPLGAIPVRNKIEVLRPDLLSVEALPAISDGMFVASVAASQTPVDGGVEHNIEVSMNMSDHNGEQVQAFRQSLTLLNPKRESNMQSWGEKRHFAESRDQQPLLSWAAQQPSDSKPLPFHLGRCDPARWVALCKDFNPVHTSERAARFFRFPSVIAHGNHIAAKAWQEIARHTQVSWWDAPTYVNIHYQQQIPLPADLKTQTPRAIGHDKMSFEVCDDMDKLCVAVEYGKIVE